MLLFGRTQLAASLSAHFEFIIGVQGPSSLWIAIGHRDSEWAYLRPRCFSTFLWSTCTSTTCRHRIAHTFGPEGIAVNEGGLTRSRQNERLARADWYQDLAVDVLCPAAHLPRLLDLSYLIRRLSLAQAGSQSFSCAFKSFLCGYILSRFEDSKEI